MRLNVRSDKILKILRTIYPDVKTQLFHDTPFQLLVATILSAQCTDKQVNRVTRVMFNHLKTPADFANAPIKPLKILSGRRDFITTKPEIYKIAAEHCWKSMTDGFHRHWKHLSNCPVSVVKPPMSYWAPLLEFPVL
jgi:endonuclease III